MFNQEPNVQPGDLLRPAGAEAAERCAGGPPSPTRRTPMIATPVAESAPRDPGLSREPGPGKGRERGQGRHVPCTVVAEHPHGGGNDGTRYD